MKTDQSSHRKFTLTAAVGAALAGFSVAQVSAATWNTASGNWSTSGNWTGGVPNAAGAVAAFPTENSNSKVITVDGTGFTIGSMTLNGANTNKKYTISGTQSLTLDATTGNAAITASTTGHVINVNLILRDSLDLNGAAALDLNGAISTGTGTTDVNISGGGIVTMAGFASNTYNGVTAISTGGLNLSKTGTANAIAGALNITGGTVTYLASGGSTDMIANTAAVTVSGGTLNFSNVNDIIGSLTFNSGTVSNVSSLTLTSTGTALSLRNTSVGGNIILSGASGGTVAFDATGNPATGASLVNLALGGVTRTFDIADSTNAAVDMNVTGVLSATGTFGINKSGAGTLQVSGASSNTYTGLTSVSAGTLLLGKTSSALAIAGDGVAGTDDLVISGGLVQYASTAGTDQIANAVNVKVAGGTLDLNGKSDTFNTLTVSNGAVSTGAGTLTLTTLSYGAGSFAGNLSVGGNISATNTSGTVIVGAAVDLTSGAHTLDVANGGTTDFAGIVSGTGAILNKTGLGTLVLSGNNSYTGGTTIGAGTIQLGHSGAIGSNGTIGFTGGTLRYTSSNNTDYSSRFSTDASQQYNIDTNGQSVTLSTALTSSGGSLTKIGSGILTLNGASTYGGDTNVNGGTLQLGSSDRIANSSRLVLNGGTFATGGFDEIAATMKVTDNSTIDMAGGDSVLEFDESFGEAWTAGKTLTILNWDNDMTGLGNDRIYIGTAYNGLDVSQLAQIQFVNPTGMAPGTYSAMLLEDGQVVAPEPASLSLVALGASALLMRRRRKA